MPEGALQDWACVRQERKGEQEHLGLLRETAEGKKGAAGSQAPSPCCWADQQGATCSHAPHTLVLPNRDKGHRVSEAMHVDSPKAMECCISWKMQAPQLRTLGVLLKCHFLQEALPSPLVSTCFVLSSPLFFVWSQHCRYPALHGHVLAHSLIFFLICPTRGRVLSGPPLFLEPSTFLKRLPGHCINLSGHC